jgi:hypothetical protein
VNGGGPTRGGTVVNGAPGVVLHAQMRVRKGPQHRKEDGWGSASLLTEGVDRWRREDRAVALQ